MVQLLVKLKEHSHIRVQAFVDMVIGISGSSVSHSIQMGLNLISRWCGDQGLSISTEKTVSVKFILCKKEADKAITLKLNKNPIDYF